MRKIFLFMMVSVDGYFEGTNHDLSWHNVDAEFNAFAYKQLDNSVDTILFGRKTYELMESFWPKPEGMEVDPNTARFMNETQKIVASHEAFNSDWNNTTIIHENVIAEIEKMKSQPGKDIVILGSNNLCIGLMEKGLVDEFRIMVNPVAIGTGSSLFVGLTQRIKMKLIKTREFKSGNVLNYYSIV